MKKRAMILRVLPAVALAAAAGMAMASTDLVAAGSPSTAEVQSQATPWTGNSDAVFPSAPGATADDDGLTSYEGLPAVSPTIEAPPTSFLDGVTTMAKGDLPEPTAWALMLIGFGGVGALLRARRRALRV